MASSRGTWTRTALVVALVAAATGGPPFVSSASGQGVRGQAVTLGRYVSIRPLVRDSVPRDQVIVGAGGSLEFQGHPVFCVGDFQCTFYRSADTEHAFELTQDVSLTAWGLGVEGLSATALLRARADLGGAFTWPRGDDAFDAILAYAELTRARYRVRVGRQETYSGLGFASFDGASLLLDPLPWLRVEGYGGRSLAQGLSEPRNDALRGVEDFVPDRNAYILGADAEVSAFGASVDARYQREIWSDRSGLLSERASLSLAAPLRAGFTLSGAVDYDFAFGHLGKARLSLHAPVPRFRLVVDAAYRHYIPYFELWTIWGYFSPVGYDEGDLTATWAARPDLGIWASAGLRRYGDAGTTLVLTPIENESHRFGLGARWSPTSPWSAEASYRQERGFGATLSNGEATVRWSPAERLSVAAYATAFQQIEEFRVGEGAVLGGGLSVSAPLPRGASLDAGLAVYRNAFAGRPSSTDWNQLRAWSGLRIPIGTDPGATPPGGAP